MSPDRHARTMLPIPDRPAPGLTTYDAKDPDTSYPPIEPLLPPEGAPNVLVILLDDVGFGASSAFGGPCNTPTAERLAAGGLRYNRFHTTALCAPTRQALLTGRNHHSVGMGSITETATSAPGNNSLRPNTKAPLAMTLKLNGYSTAQFGKCHEVPVWQSSPMGPFDAWPSGGGGFETFYGFIGGENNQYDPALYERHDADRAAGDRRGGLPPHRGPGRQRHQLGSPAEGTDARQAVLRLLRSRRDPRPAPRAQGVGRQVRRPVRRRVGRPARAHVRPQKELGVIPDDAELTAANPEIPAWDDMPDELKPVLARQMEVYAGFLEHTDHHVGRLIDAIDDLGVLDDTLVYYIVGDNGASAEGTLNGAFNEMANFNGMAALETPEFMISKMDDFGSPESYNHYSVGWAWAMNTPFQWTKQVASHWGGTRNGTIVHWPNGIDDPADCASSSPTSSTSHRRSSRPPGLPEPTMVNGVQQSPMEGTSMLYTFNQPDEPERHDLQYFEMFGNRGIYHKGWSAVTKHRTPWVMVGGDLPAFDDDVWELYDGSADYSQARDLSAEHPELLAKLQRLWLIEAVKYNVVPMDDRTAERIEPSMAGPADADPRELAAVLPRHGTAVREQRRQHQEPIVLVTAEIEVPDGVRRTAC
jgi:arylsulfatase A-like enzyme